MMLMLACSAPTSTAPTLDGLWTAWLDSPGGALRFGLESGADGITLINGSERLSFPRTSAADGRTTVHLDPYDASLEIMLSPDGQRFDGRWHKQKRGRTDTLALHGTRGNSLPTRTGSGAAIEGRWAVDFSSDELDAVGVFGAGERSTGTFLTALGDYRFLAGHQDGDTLELSCFDGSHAFLFRATHSGGELAGDFWSGGGWHETWTAVPKADAALPDGFSLSHVVNGPRLAELAFPDVDGVETQVLMDAPAQIITLFGSWCPNCNDEAVVLQELHQRYGSKGLRVVGLAFEHGDAFARDAAFVKRFATRHGVTFPLLVAGSSDKAAATATFGVLDQVRAFPTTLFVKDGKIESVHTGFSGPADVEGHRELRAAWEDRVQSMLAR